MTIEWNLKQLPFFRLQKGADLSPTRWYASWRNQHIRTELFFSLLGSRLQTMSQKKKQKRNREFYEWKYIKAICTYFFYLYSSLRYLLFKYTNRTRLESMNAASLILIERNFFFLAFASKTKKKLEWKLFFLWVKRDEILFCPLNRQNLIFWCADYVCEQRQTVFFFGGRKETLIAQ